MDAARKARDGMHYTRLPDEPDGEPQMGWSVNSARMEALRNELEDLTEVLPSIWKFHFWS